MAGICCICRKSIGVGRVVEGRVVTSFALSHYTLCPACLGRTQADISRIYGPATTGPVAQVTNPAPVEQGSGA
jgi:hypothetical protein